MSRLVREPLDGYIPVEEVFKKRGISLSLRRNGLHDAAAMADRGVKGLFSYSESGRLTEETKANLSAACLFLDLTVGNISMYKDGVSSDSPLTYHPGELFRDYAERIMHLPGGSLDSQEAEAAFDMLGKISELRSFLNSLRREGIKIDIGSTWRTYASIQSSYINLALASNSLYPDRERLSRYYPGEILD